MTMLLLAIPDHRLHWELPGKMAPANCKFYQEPATESIAIGHVAEGQEHCLL